ncbi:MAG: hypothetical protein KatS3mg016_1032 [Fimbriimonadales bacterium]|nr:MAG: hypothetical protein KatS3mg016_1032 [Fimbriimonadales bacterium]
MRKRRPRRGFDEAWKYAIRTFFRECLQLLFPAVHDQVDWTRPVEFLDANLYRLAPAVRGKRRQTADIVAKVSFHDGTERIVMIHIEIQAQPDPNFALRMFVYHYHIFDAYEYPEVVSLAILADADPNWRPNTFGYQNIGSELQFRFSTVKLLDFDETVLERSRNPFALVVLAHLRALKTRGKPNLLLSEKIALIRQLRERGYTVEQVIHLYKVVDFMMTLSQELEQLVQQVVRQFEEESEWPLTSLEEFAIERGAKQGLQQGLQQGIIESTMYILHRRFGDDALALEPQLKQIESIERLRELSAFALDAATLEEFAQAMEAAKI